MLLVLFKSYRRKIFPVRPENISGLTGRFFPSGGKEKDRKNIPIAPELLPILRRCYRLTPSARCIDVAPEALDRRWKRVQTDLDLSRRYRLHDLRHTYVTRAILSGINPRVVQYLAGHSSLELTLQVYSHITIEAAQAEIRRVASLH